MTEIQKEQIRKAVNEYVELSNMVSTINNIIGEHLLFTLISAGISDNEAKEIYLETVTRQAVRVITPKSFNFIKPFIEDKEG